MKKLGLNIYLRFPGGKAKAFTLSYDDGVEQDIKLVEILRRYNLKGTFNINSGIIPAEDSPPPAKWHRRLKLSELIKLFEPGDMEVAVHTSTHPNLTLIPIDTAAWEVISDRKYLENIFNKQIRGMAYPYGTYNDELIKALKSCGIYYARTVKGTENFQLPDEFLTWHPTCHHNHKDLLKFTETFLIDEPLKNPLLFYVWGHSYEFDEKNNWDLIENFAKTIANKENIWYATNMEIYTYVKAFQALEFSIDTKYVYNPTCTDIWFKYSDNNINKIIKAESGKATIII